MLKVTDVRFITLLFLLIDCHFCDGAANNANTITYRQSQWETVKPFCTANDGSMSRDSGHERMSPRKPIINNLQSLSDDILCTKRRCPLHSFCFLGACPCHPGYIGDKCDIKMEPSSANPWYTDNCPNLRHDNTINIEVPLIQVGGEHTPKVDTHKATETSDIKSSHSSSSSSSSRANKSGKRALVLDSTNSNNAEQPKNTAYLCYSHPSYGTAVVPKSLWRAAQQAEGNLWQEVGKYALAADANDRAVEHWKAFGMFSALLGEKTGSISGKNSSFGNQLPNLGRVIEVGAGPWTQLKGLLYVRPELQVEEFTIWEPGANRYMKEVPSCSYRDGKSLSRWRNKDSPALSETVSASHAFPIKIVSTGGELLTSAAASAASDGATKSTTKSSAAASASQLPEQYDTLISINVLEHVQDAFQYLNGLYLSIRAGGILIMHERYYDLKTVMDGDLNHPVRIKRQVLDRFLSGFDVLFNNCSANYDNRPNERGYYVIARKLPSI